jgi:hypothetical protein
VVLGDPQTWWLQPLLIRLDADAVLVGATLLTSVTADAALIDLGSLVPNLSQEFKAALISGAVAGGGLTAFANAPYFGRGGHPARPLRGRYDQPVVAAAGGAAADDGALAGLRWL